MQIQIREALNFAKREISELDAQVLLGFVLGMSKLDLFMNSQVEVKSEDFEVYKKLINRRKNCEPVAYITGHKEFFGLDFLVNKHTLIPRPDTEVLVEQVLEKIRYNKKKTNLKILDICTGTACVIISVCKNLENNNKKFNFYASDISEEALRVAKENARNLGANIEFAQSDLFEFFLDKPEFENCFDLITANPPYISQNEYGDLESAVRDFEPKSALVADDNGLYFYREILGKAKSFLKK